LSPRVRVFIDWARDLYSEKFGAATTAVDNKKPL